MHPSDPGPGERLLTGLLAALDRAERHERPFGHLLLEDVVSPEMHATLREKLPAPETYDPDRPQKYRRPDGTVARSVLPLDDHGIAPLPPDRRGFWADVRRSLSSPALKARVFGLLGRDLGRRFRMSPDALAGLDAHPRASLVRDLPGYWIEPHPDSPAKVVTLQIYLPSHGSPRHLGTSFYRLRPWGFLRTGRLLEEFRRVPFEPGCGYAFAVGRKSWHGVERIPDGSGVRDSLMLVWFRDPARRR